MASSKDVRCGADKDQDSQKYDIVNVRKVDDSNMNNNEKFPLIAAAEAGDLTKCLELLQSANKHDQIDGTGVRIIHSFKICIILNLI